MNDGSSEWQLASRLLSRIDDGSIFPPTCCRGKVQRWQALAPDDGGKKYAAAVFFLYFGVELQSRMPGEDWILCFYPAGAATSITDAMILPCWYDNGLLPCWCDYFIYGLGSINVQGLADVVFLLLVPPFETNLQE